MLLDIAAVTIDNSGGNYIGVVRVGASDGNCFILKIVMIGEAVMFLIRKSCFFYRILK